MPASTREPVPLRWGARLATVVWWLLGTCLLLLALYAGIGRQLIQNLDYFRPDLVRELSARTGLEVGAGELEGRWSWLDPILIAHDIQLGDADNGQVSVQIRQLRVRLDFIASLARLRLVFAEFEADGVDLRVKQPGDDAPSASGATPGDAVTDVPGGWTGPASGCQTPISA